MHSYSARVVAVLVTFALAGCSKPATRQQTYERLYRAGRTIEGSIGVGVSYVDLGTLLRELSTEILIARDTAKTDGDKALVNAYADVLLVYKDSLLVWKLQIDSAKYEWLEGQIPVDRSLAALAAKYNLTSSDVTPSFSGNSVTVIPADSMQKIWEVAAEKSRHAALLYFGGSDAK
jgi:hypothetical protein